MLLTDQEIKRVIGTDVLLTSQHIFARAIESAVLAKLKAQEPVAVADGTFNHNCDLGVSLYPNPLPPDDVVRDAERLDWIQANCRCDPMMDGQHKWWPTNFNKCLTGPSIREAIDAAMEKA